jgi:hypothetical protein
MNAVVQHFLMFSRNHHRQAAHKLGIIHFSFESSSQTFHDRVKLIFQISSVRLGLRYSRKSPPETLALMS